LPAMFQLLRRLAAPNVFNPWSDADPLDRTGDAVAHRLQRLKRHLACRPSLLLVGEAAGYQGCRFSGVAFTSERLLLEERIPRVLCTERITHRTRPWSEPSATIVWGCLHGLALTFALLWRGLLAPPPRVIGWAATVGFFIVTIAFALYLASGLPAIRRWVGRAETPVARQPAASGPYPSPASDR